LRRVLGMGTCCGAQGGESPVRKGGYEYRGGGGGNIGGGKQERNLGGLGEGLRCKRGGLLIEA